MPKIVALHAVTFENVRKSYLSFHTTIMSLWKFVNHVCVRVCFFSFFLALSDAPVFVDLSMSFLSVFSFFLSRTIMMHHFLGFILFSLLKCFARFVLGQNNIPFTLLWPSYLCSSFLLFFFFFSSFLFSRVLRDSTPRFVGPSVGPSVRRPVGPSVGPSVRHTLLFLGFLGFLASLLLPKWSGDLNYGPCPPARDWGSRVSGLV